jgi:hypothetical protein
MGANGQYVVLIGLVMTAVGCETVIAHPRGAGSLIVGLLLGGGRCSTWPPRPGPVDHRPQEAHPPVDSLPNPDRRDPRGRRSACAGHTRRRRCRPRGHQPGSTTTPVRPTDRRRSDLSRRAGRSGVAGQQRQARRRLPHRARRSPRRASPHRTRRRSHARSFLAQTAIRKRCFVNLLPSRWLAFDGGPQRAPAVNLEPWQFRRAPAAHRAEHNGGTRPGGWHDQLDRHRSRRGRPARLRRRGRRRLGAACAAEHGCTRSGKASGRPPGRGYATAGSGH